MLDEVVRTSGDLRARTNPKYRHDQRWEDLLRCLTLDGYRVDGKQVVPVDPTIRGTAAVDDDLSSELKASGLGEAINVLQLLENSPDAFRKAPPDYNACLANARAGLETLAKGIANVRLQKNPASFDSTPPGTA